MKKVFFAFAVLISCRATAQPLVNLCVSSGTDIIKTRGILFGIVGQYRGSTNELGVTIAPRIGAMAELRFGKFQCATGLNMVLIPYHNIVHRYEIYYTPAGNPYGGDIYDEEKGNYWAVEIPVRADYFFLSVERRQFGLSASLIGGRIMQVETNYGNDFGSPTSYEYAMGTGGMVFDFHLQKHYLTLRPQVLFTIAQEKNFFYPVGGLVELSIGNTVWGLKSVKE